MARFTFTNEFRKRFSEKLMDLGNLSAAALVFGQFASPKEFFYKYINSWIIFYKYLLYSQFCYKLLGGDTMNNLVLFFIILSIMVIAGGILIKRNSK